MKKNGKKPHKAKRTAHEVLYLRVPPHLYALISEQVRGMNESRQWSDRPVTIQGFAIRCIEQQFEPDATRVTKRKAG